MLICTVIITGINLAVVIVESIMFSRMIGNGGIYLAYEYNPGVIWTEFFILCGLGICDAALIIAALKRLSNTKR